MLRPQHNDKHTAQDHKSTDDEDASLCILDDTSCKTLRLP